MTRRTAVVALLGLGLLSSACLALSAASKPPTKEEVLNGDYGPAPTPEEAKQIINRYVDEHLTHPESGKVRNIRGPEKAYLAYADSPLGKNNLARLRQEFGKPEVYAFYGYRVCFEVDGRNDFGAYTGYMLTGLFIKDGAYHWSVIDDPPYRYPAAKYCGAYEKGHPLRASAEP
ncbi:MAG: hypothetical protein HYZ28_19830 [Myxococcales bacterium]|nr:hypothetical protein [Myxococcales bacterium]